MSHALIVDDDANTPKRSMPCAAEGFTAATAGTLRDARRQLALQQPDIVLLDLQLPDGNGMDLLDDLEPARNTEVVLITGHASVETAVEALRLRRRRLPDQAGRHRARCKAILAARAAHAAS